jgi:hypothetical protein
MMRVIRLVSGAEIRLPLDQIESISDIEESGSERPVPPHPYFHKEGVKRCAACWRDRTDPSHTDVAVRL